jgi:ATP-dependent protease Clp ATPase subunit
MSIAQFARSESGDCTFCGKQPAEVGLIARAEGHPTQICNECTTLCAEMLAEKDEPRPTRSPTERIAEIRDDLEERGVPKDRIDRLEHRMRLNLEDPEQQERLRAGRETHACSFCDAIRKDVDRLIAGPRVFICDVCVVASVAFAARELA